MHDKEKLNKRIMITTRWTVSQGKDNQIHTIHKFDESGMYRLKCSVVVQNFTKVKLEEHLINVSKNIIKNTQIYQTSTFTKRLITENHIYNPQMN